MRVHETDVRLEEHAERQYLKALAEVQERLRALARELSEDPELGEYVPPKQVPNKDTLKKWEKWVGPVKNLYKLELPGAWCALYTIGSTGAQRIVLVLEVVDHKRYDRLTGYL